MSRPGHLDSETETGPRLKPITPGAARAPVEPSRLPRHPGENEGTGPPRAQGGVPSALAHPFPAGQHWPLSRKGQ